MWLVQEGIWSLQVHTAVIAGTTLLHMQYNELKSAAFYWTCCITAGPLCVKAPNGIAHLGIKDILLIPWASNVRHRACPLETALWLPTLNKERENMSLAELCFRLPFISCHSCELPWQWHALSLSLSRFIAWVIELSDCLFLLACLIFSHRLTYSPALLLHHVHLQWKCPFLPLNFELLFDTVNFLSFLSGAVDEVCLCRYSSLSQPLQTFTQVSCQSQQQSGLQQGLIEDRSWQAISQAPQPISQHLLHIIWT